MSRRSPTLALCVIAKNEERFIAECLDSARRFVDEVVVLDTGSTDRTREIAKEHGARVEEFVWIDDFAAARNAAIDAATSDWILMLDADERLDQSSGPALRRLARQTSRAVHALCPAIENVTLDETDQAGKLASSVLVPRFFPRRDELRFVSAIHEVITYLPNPDGTIRIPAPELRIKHYGYDPTVYAERNKDQRNLSLLEREVERGSDDPRMPYFLIQQHLIAQRPTDVVAGFDAFLRQLPRLASTFAVEGYTIYLSALAQLGDETQLLAAEQEASTRGYLGVSALEALAVFYAERGDLQRAIAYRKRQLDPRLPAGIDFIEGRGTWATRLALAGLYGDSGEPGAALEELKRAFAILPEDRRAEISYQALSYALRQNQPEAACHWAARAIEHASESIEAHQRVLELVLQLHASTPDLAASLPFAAVDRALAGQDLQQVYDRASEISPDSLAAQVRLIAAVERVRAADEHEAALALLNQALDGPRLEQVYWLLIKTLTQLGRYQDAQLAVDALRGLRHVQNAA